MIKEAIEKIQELARKADQTVIGKDGKEYSYSKLSPVYHDPRPADLHLYSLQGILDYLADNVDQYETKNLMLHVVAHDRVDLITDIHGEKNERHTILSATLDGEKFRFEQFMDQELFIIRVKSLFQNTEDRESILHHTATINTESAIKTQDDGITQQIQVKKGLSGALVEKADLKSIVSLKPFRTFREIDQPEGEFLFRMKSLENGVQCALFEADGGSWKIEARKRIAEFFTDAGVAIIA